MRRTIHCGVLQETPTSSSGKIQPDDDTIKKKILMLKLFSIFCGDGYLGDYNFLNSFELIDEFVFCFLR